MKSINPSPFLIASLCCMLFSLLSCSKDADLLSDIVINNPTDIKAIAILQDDVFSLSRGQTSVLLNVLENDSFNGNSSVTITNASTANNGTVTINADNTLTYVPKPAPTVVVPESPQVNTPPVEEIPEEETPTEEVPTEETPTTPEPTIEEDDSFTYTAEITDEDTGETVEEVATVTVKVTDLGPVKAFPSAEGFGQFTTGGRGGAVIHVTNLNDDGSGSLRAALETKGRRTIVFDVGGTIQLSRYLQIGSGNFNENSALENITIAGETAPFPGITIKGGVLNIFTSNVIIRYLTVRTDIEAVETEDAIRIRNWGVNNYSQKNIILDHCSLSHGSDENLSIGAASSEARIEKVTIQNCLLGENSSEQKNMLRGNYVYDLSVINNFWTECMDRNMLVGYGSGGETLEFINNIVYGYENGLAISRGNRIDGIANIYQSYTSNPNKYNVITLGSQSYNNKVGSGAIFIDGNFVSGPMEEGASAYNLELLDYNRQSRVITNSVKTNWETDKQAIENKVLPKVGNSLHRDELDQNWVDSYYDGNGRFGYTSVPIKSATSRPASFDTDKDGMADDWERAVFGNLSKSASGDDNNDGYTNLETYLFSLSR